MTPPQFLHQSPAVQAARISRRGCRFRSDETHETAVFKYLETKPRQTSEPWWRISSRRVTAFTGSSCTRRLEWWGLNFRLSRMIPAPRKIQGRATRASRGKSSSDFAYIIWLSKYLRIK